MTGKQQAEAEVILQMVGDSAAVVAPDEKADTFEEYAEFVHRTGQLSQESPRGFDSTAKGLLDLHSFYVVGLPLLAALAKLLLGALQSVVLEKGIEHVLERLRAVVSQRKNPDYTTIARELNLIVLNVPPGISSEVLATAIIEQSRTLLNMEAEKRKSVLEAKG